MDPVDEIAEEGFTVLRDVFDAERATALVADLARMERELDTQPAGNSFEGARTLRVYNLLAHGALWQELAIDTAVLPVVEGVLDRGCLMSSLSSIRIQPGEVAQPIHADDQVIPLGKPHAPTVCNTMWALTDFTEANGATRVIAGSHLRDHDPEYGARYDSEPAEMSRGSVLVWHGSLWHGGGANSTDQDRIGVAANYCAGFIRQQENQQLGLDRDLVASFPPRLRELVGYGIYRGLIGHIDKRTPADAVLGSGADPMLWDGA